MYLSGQIFVQTLLHTDGNAVKTEPLATTQSHYTLLQNINLSVDVQIS